MGTVTFDTLKYLQQLEDSGIPKEQAEAFVKAQKEIFAEAVDTTVATKNDIHDINKKLTEHDARFTLLQWMIGFNIAFTMAILWKVFS